MLIPYSKDITPTTKASLVPIDDRAEFLSKLIGIVISLAGKSIEPEDLALLVVEINNALDKRFKNLAMLEVETALRNGVNGVYGDFYNIASKELHHWLVEFSKAKSIKEQRNVDGMPTQTRANFILVGLAKYKQEKEAKKKTDSQT